MNVHQQMNPSSAAGFVCFAAVSVCEMCFDVFAFEPDMLFLLQTFCFMFSCITCVSLIENSPHSLV